MLIVRIEPREFDTTSTQGARAHLRVLGLAAVVPLLVSLLLGGLIFSEQWDSTPPRTPCLLHCSLVGSVGLN